MEENHYLDMTDDICMKFLESRDDLKVKEGIENRVHNVITLDKSDIAIAAIDYTLKYLDKQSHVTE